MGGPFRPEAMIDTPFKTSAPGYFKTTLVDLNSGSLLLIGSIIDREPNGFEQDPVN